MKSSGTIDTGDIKYTINGTLWHDVLAEKIAIETEYLVTHNSVFEATHLEKNVSIPAGRFKVPEGITIQ